MYQYKNFQKRFFFFLMKRSVVIGESLKLPYLLNPSSKNLKDCQKKVAVSWTILQALSETELRSHGLPALSCVWQHIKLLDRQSWDPSAI